MAARLKLPFVTTYHGVYNAKGRIKRWYNSVMARGDKVIANSDYTAAHVRWEHPEAASRIVTIHRGVDIAKFETDYFRHSFYADLGLSRGTFFGAEHFGRDTPHLVGSEPGRPGRGTAGHQQGGKAGGTAQKLAAAKYV